MNAKDGKILALMLGGANLVLFVICFLIVWLSRSQQRPWLKITLLAVFGAGSLLFGACALFWGYGGIFG